MLLGCSLHVYVAEETETIIQPCGPRPWPQSSCHPPAHVHPGDGNAPCSTLPRPFPTPKSLEVPLSGAQARKDMSKVHISRVFEGEFLLLCPAGLWHNVLIGKEHRRW